MKRLTQIEIVIRDKDYNIVESIIKEFDTPEEAYQERYRILDNLKPGLRVAYNKVYPVVICSCGQRVECVSFTNTCEECYRDYNFAGEPLASREQWGEETGEHWTDCY